MPIPNEYVMQAAAIPVKDGQVCLVTSRSGKRWVIPKGLLELGKSSGEIALQEAWEEAGLVGVLRQQPVGSYLYDKMGNTCHVTVFYMEATSSAERWPEQNMRERIWVTPAQCLSRVDDQGLRAVLRAVLLPDPASGGR